ncbi:hypothetical protein SDC9_181548 [bioreactor metagenome]|uniref:Uncharacterized protein n=1 Tax=bioreactor metagenome TaxID=1076179 RepID=A0A645H6D5_9ZZZZ
MYFRTGLHLGLGIDAVRGKELYVLFGAIGSHGLGGVLEIAKAPLFGFSDPRRVIAVAIEDDAAVLLDYVLKQGVKVFIEILRLF